MTADQRPFYTQPAAVATAVVLLHAGGLYALQSGLLRRAVELVVPIEMLSQIITPAQPLVQPPPPQPKPTPAPQPKTQAKAPAPAPQPLALRDNTPSPTAPQGIATPAPPAPPMEVAQATAAVPAAAAAPATPAKVELPSSEADYLNNPPPAYPPVSRRLGEMGKVMVRVYIGADGIAQKGEVRTSSGFERLDAAALAAALKWRYTPGKRGGTAEAMWVNVPINFTLN